MISLRSVGSFLLALAFAPSIFATDGQVYAQPRGTDFVNERVGFFHLRFLRSAQFSMQNNCAKVMA
jgi:hypothetical protein